MMPLDINQLKKLHERAKSRQLTAEDRELVIALIQSYRELVNLLKDPGTSLDDLYQHLGSYENDTASGDATNDRSDSIQEAREE